MSADWSKLNPTVVEQYERSLKVSCPTCHQPKNEMCVCVRAPRKGQQSSVPHIPRIKKSWKLAAKKAWEKSERENLRRNN